LREDGYRGSETSNKGIIMRMSELRAMDNKQLIERLPQLRLERGKFKSADGSGETLIKLPLGKHGGVSWGMAKKVKKEIAQVLTILHERGLDI
jgi:ribosomal protein L29